MASVAVVRPCVLRNLSSFIRNFCSKSDEFNLPVNFKYPTNKIIDDERKKSWKNHRSDDWNTNFRRPTFDKRYRKIQNSTTDSNRAEMTMNNDIRSIPDKYDNVNNMFVSQDLMKVEGTPAKNRKHVPSQVLHTERALPSGRIKAGTVIGEILFGINPVAMALSVKRRSFYKLFVKRNSAENSRISAIEAQAKSMNVLVVKVDVDTLNEMSDGRPHQGVCLDAGMLYFEMEMDERNVKEEPLWIFMDKIQDPMNLGAVLRSCYYFGIDRVFTVKSHTCKLTPVVSKASSGAMEMLNVYAIEHPSEFLKKKIKEGWNIIGSASTDSLDRENIAPHKIVDLNNFDWPKPTILLVGNEGGGIDSELLRFCDRVVTISNCNSYSPGMMSLNVSVATGIILHSCCSQLLHTAKRQSDEAIGITAVE